MITSEEIEQIKRDRMNVTLTRQNLDRLIVEVERLRTALKEIYHAGSSELCTAIAGAALQNGENAWAHEIARGALED